jgi:hypothetical protein
MVRENVAVVQRVAEALRRGDYEAANRDLSADIVSSSPGEGSWAAPMPSV